MSRRKIVHVYQQRIRQNINKPAADREPPVIVREGKAVRYGNTVEITGPSRLVYSPDKPLKCGARVWLETASEVLVID